MESQTEPGNASANSAKRFVCEEPGCGRAFTRSEHVHRHMLNHTKGSFTCDRCRAHFKRKDLLERHLARHRQKDKEGSTLNTRKRMWKTFDGNIVAKRPNLSQQAPSSSSIAPGSVSDTNGNKSQSPLAEAPISPPPSIEHSELTPTSLEQHNFDQQDLTASNIVQPVPIQSEIVHAGDSPEISYQLPFAQDQFWAGDFEPAPPQRSSEQALPYEDVFNPDTASSFNMPFTTMNNYSWLFDLSSAQMTASGSTMPEFQTLDTTEMHHPSAFMNGCSPTNFLEEQSNQQCQLSTSVDSIASSHLFMSSDFGSQHVEPDLNSQRTLSHQSGEPFHDELTTLPAIEQPRQPENASTNGAAPSQGSESRNAPRSRPVQDARNTQRVTRRGPKNLPERPLSMIKRGRSLPVIDEVARAQILDLIESSRPKTPDGADIHRDHPLLSLSQLQTYCDLFFTRFNTAYPLLHQASFDASHVETLLLMSVLLVGATYCEKDAHQLAVCIHDVLRPQIFANAGFSPKPELWMLQTILLVECFGKSRAGQKQHDMAHLFHGLLINLIRRSDCQTVRVPGLEQATDDLEDDWRTWALAEQKKRLALLCFMWDVQHAVLFCQSLCMSAFELRSSLPCDQSLWEADSAKEWHQLHQSQKPPPMFLSLLKSLLIPGAPAIPPHVNALSRVLLFHGLMSISWDMKRRDQTSLGIIGSDPVIGDWKTRLGASYDAWKMDFDSYCLHMRLNASNDSTLVNEINCFSVAYSAIYHAAHVILNAEFLDLQIYAGARHILGRPVGRQDYIRSQRVVKAWVKEQTSQAAKAAWHAAHLLKEGLQNQFEVMGLFHFPWCLYLATITCWAFYHASPVLAERHNSARPGAEAPGDTYDDPGDEDDEMVWDAKAEMTAMISGMTNTEPDNLAAMAARRKIRTSGLTAIIAKHLSTIRWAIVHEGMIVLKGLVPWRLINQYESFA